MKSVYSPSQHAIYNSAFYTDYQRAGTWPSDGIEISDEDALKFNGSNEPSGKMLDHKDSALCWSDRPAPELTKDQLAAQAEQKKSSLRANAESEIEWRRDAIDLQIATDEEAAALVEWKKYRILLNRVDTSTTQTIEWPQAPSERAL